MRLFPSLSAGVEERRTGCVRSSVGILQRGWRRHPLSAWTAFGIAGGTQELGAPTCHGGAGAPSASFRSCVMDEPRASRAGKQALPLRPASRRAQTHRWCNSIEGSRSGAANDPALALPFPGSTIEHPGASGVNVPSAADACALIRRPRRSRSAGANRRRLKAPRSWCALTWV